MNENIPRLIKTAKKVFQYEGPGIPSRKWGFPRDVYYDRVSEVFIIDSFPTTGHQHEVGMPLENGFADITVADTSYHVRIYEA